MFMYATGKQLDVSDRSPWLGDMAKVWTLLLSFFISLPVAVYLIVACVFDHDERPADPADYLHTGWKTHPFLSPHLRARTAVPPFSTRGRRIVDRNGEPVRLFSVNWYGASDGGFVPGGLDIRHRKDISMTIKQLGFNSVRLPYADELVYTNPVVNSSRLIANGDLAGKTALDVFASVVEALTDAGLYVIINNHITQARWCCDANLCDGLWKNDHWGPFCRIKQTEESWIQNLEKIMQPHIHNTLVIGVDLRNEVRGVTDRLVWDSWASAAERAAARLHSLQSQWLMFVEGVSSANNIAGAHARPIALDVPNKLVYSAHVYAWSGWGSMIPFFKRPYQSFADEMHRNWGYLLMDDVAPVWIGEFGAPRHPSRSDLHYWNNLMRYLRLVEADIGYWAINPRKWGNQAAETYSLLRDDWKTPILDYRLFDMLRLVAA